VQIRPNFTRIAGKYEGIGYRKEAVMKKKVLIVNVLLVLSVGISALAFDPLGPPTAGLKRGQSGIAAEYAYSRSDVEISSRNVGGITKRLKSDMFLARPAYGVTDNWELYALLGAAGNKMGKMDFGYGFAYGFGTKYTFAKNETLSWGVLFEAGWKAGDASGTMDLTELTDWEYFEEDYDAELSYNEIMIAIGPTWEIAEGLRIYGGPFFYKLNGDIDMDIEFWEESISFDLEEKSRSGGYFGAEWDICPNTSWYGEIQLTGDMWDFGTGICWKL
jgi:hypothetical protein